MGDERDVELAKSYYEQALANGSWSEDMAVSLNVPNDTYEACANIVKANCAEIGLNVDVIRRDSIPTIQQNMFFAPTEGYMAVLWSFAPTIDPAKVGIYLQKEYTDDNFFARWGVREEDAADNQGYTDAFHLWAGAQTPEDEKKYAEELQRWENEGAPCIAICNVRAIYACGTNVAGADSPWIDVTGVNYYSQDVWNWICYQK
jgi:ABC-type transport system substrate-binding protein